MPRREAFKEKARSGRRVPWFICEPSDGTDLSLGAGELTADFVEREVSL